jgi:hypothetical protein
MKPKIEDFADDLRPLIEHLATALNLHPDTAGRALYHDFERHLVKETTLAFVIGEELWLELVTKRNKIICESIHTAFLEHRKEMN